MSSDAVRALLERFAHSERSVPTSRLGRLWRTGRGAAGLGLAVLRSKESSDLASISRLVTQLGELKGLAMKAGQLLGYLDPTLPDELRGLLTILQTSSPASPFDQVEATLRAALGERAQLLLTTLNRKPIAVASIGQVHRARLPDGTEVAVKIRHPGIEAALRGDFASAAGGSVIAGLLVPGANVASFVEEARTAILEECDFALEATRQQTFAQLFADDAVISVPRVHPEWSGPTVLTSQWLPGRSLDDFLAANPPQPERDRFGEALFRFYVGALYRHGLFHADPHPGNYGFREDGRLVVYDFGCVRSFDPATVAAFSRLVAAMRADDPTQMRSALEGLGGKPPENAATLQHVRGLMRGFFAPLLRPGPHRIEPGDGFEARQVLEDKRALMKLRLPGRLLFLFRLRFGLYSVLSRLGASVDWASLEWGWASR